VRLYPKPVGSNSIINIESHNKYDLVEVFSLTGELKATHQLNNQSQINLNLNSGSYILKTTDSVNKNYSVNKIIVL
jgi:hypothetical protein